MSAMLTRMKELATQAINGTYSTADRANLNLEFKQLSNEITRISENTYFNGINVINSTDSISFQVGDAASDTISTTLQRMGSAYLGETTATITDHPLTTGAATALALTSGDQARVLVGGRTFVADFVSTTGAAATLLKTQIDNAFGTDTVTISGADSDILTFAADYRTGTVVSTYAQGTGSALASQDITTATQAGEALTSINNAINDVDSYRATLGAVANRMEHAANNLMSRVEHQQSARSRIQDADYAVESANLAKAQVLQQAGTAMLAQANASSQNILSLLK